MAVLRGLRETGVGRKVLKGLMAVAQERQDRQLLLHAQRAAESFYARQGFVAVGDVFDEVGIEHIAMTCNL
jgi:predicted GNAT family N-acyltransferase